MSKSPFPALLDDLHRWGYDVARNGTVYTASLLGGEPITFRRTDTNAQLRAAHQRAADETGHRLDGASGKKARARQRAQHDTQRAEAYADYAEIQRQITDQRDRERVRRAVVARYRELQSIERLMRA